jgi:hypothetical protein
MDFNACAQSARSHIHHLAESIGGRGSCTLQEQQAAEYTAEKLRLLGARQVRVEPFRNPASTYQPYALAFATALLGSLATLVLPGTGSLAFAALLSLLGAWAMLAESDFAPHWARRLVRWRSSQNVIGVLPASQPASRRLVLCAHLDTHRTPIFYSSTTWHKLFSWLVTGAFLSMALGAVGFALAALAGRLELPWLATPAACFQLFALVMCLHADFTPFSPGANDNASGAGLTLALAEALAAHPPLRTEIILLFTGCEEAGAGGMLAFLNAHQDLEQSTFYLILDEVGLGIITYNTLDGMILKRRTHPRALQLARRAAAHFSEGMIRAQVGGAYTDAQPATKRGLPALTVCAVPPPGSPDPSRWHQMGDTPETLSQQTLAQAAAFAWQILQEFDQSKD